MSRKFEDYKADVTFDVWMSGGNVDSIDMDMVRDYYYSGYYPEETANSICQRTRSEYKYYDEQYE
ncbi:hypothetical protein [Aneurinibacillus terranovensis]|uniref:hypothetical protein n=1 Tax=Aneurinibacillus terranovensis TaxID=278991 RepID=UPI0003F5B409|nr:hypothetical protein [Aneurinibacillus terranovensis]